MPTSSRELQPQIQLVQGACWCQPNGNPEWPVSCKTRCFAHATVYGIAQQGRGTASRPDLVQKGWLQPRWCCEGNLQLSMADVLHQHAEGPELASIPTEHRHELRRGAARGASDGLQDVAPSCSSRSPLRARATRAPAAWVELKTQCVQTECSGRCADVSSPAPHQRSLPSAVVETGTNALAPLPSRTAPNAEAQKSRLQRLQRQAPRLS